MHPDTRTPANVASMQQLEAPEPAIADEANQKRSESAKDQPRTETGLFEAGSATECCTTGNKHKTEQAKAAASKTNRGAVARGDKLAKGKPFDPAEFRAQIKENYEGIPPDEIALAEEEARRHPRAEWIGWASAKLVDGPQRWQDPGALAAQAFDDAGQRVQTVEPEVYAEPEPDLPDLTADMITVAIQAVSEASRGRRALQTNLAAVCVLFGKLPQRDFAVRFGLSPSALGRALENVRKILRVAQVKEFARQNGSAVP
ncbi:MAG: hypothetical protein AB9869_02235 [Verrucomicrobiia bacterium]